MLIIELRGSINTIRIDSLSSIYFDEIKKAMQLEKIGIASVLRNGYAGIDWRDFSELHYQRGLEIKPNNQLFLTSIDDNDYYGEGYTYFRDSVKNIKTNIHNFIEINQAPDRLIISSEIEYGLACQYKLDVKYEEFESKKLSINYTTLLTKPATKVAGKLFYDKFQLSGRTDFGFEKKALSIAIIEPKNINILGKSFFSNKTFKNIVLYESINYS